MSPRHRERLDLIHHNALRLLKLVNALLDFSRIEAGRIRAMYVPTDLSGFTSALASTFRSAVERAGLHLVVECPPLAEPAYVDREMWEKIVLNLVSNAFKFTFHGQIVVGLRERDGQYELSVQDTGTGIPNSDLPRVFERFHRVQAAKARTHEGTGIGLSLVQELVKLHGGTINVRSTVGTGTTFTVAIPKGKEHLPAAAVGSPDTVDPSAWRGAVFAEEALRWLPDREPAVALSSETTEPAIDRTPTARVLLVDDNPDLRTYVAGLLAPYYAVEAATDASLHSRWHASGHQISCSVTS